MHSNWLGCLPVLEDCSRMDYQPREGIANEGSHPYRESSYLIPSFAFRNSFMLYQWHEHEKEDLKLGGALTLMTTKGQEKKIVKLKKDNPGI